MVRHRCIIQTGDLHEAVNSINGVAKITHTDRRSIYETGNYIIEAVKTILAEDLYEINNSISGAAKITGNEVPGLRRANILLVWSSIRDKLCIDIA